MHQKYAKLRHLSGEDTEFITTAHLNNLKCSPVYGHFLPGRTTGQTLPCCSVLLITAPLVTALTHRGPRLTAQLLTPCGSFFAVAWIQQIWVLLLNSSRVCGILHPSRLCYFEGCYFVSAAWQSLQSMRKKTESQKILLVTSLIFVSLV